MGGPPDQPKPEPDPGPCVLRCCISQAVDWLQCVYLTCDSVVTTRFRHTALAGDEVRICPTHERMVNRASRDGFRIIYTREGWVMIDDLLRYFFGAL